MSKSASKRKKYSKDKGRSKYRPIAKQLAVDNEVLIPEDKIKQEPDDQMESADFVFKSKFLSYRLYLLVCNKKIFNQELKKKMQSYDKVAKESFLLNIYQKCYRILLKKCYSDNELWEKTNEMYRNILSESIVQLNCIESKQNVFPIENVPKHAETFKQYDFVEGYGLILSHYIPEAIRLKKLDKKKKEIDDVSRMILNRFRELKEKKKKKKIIEECPNSDVTNSISPITVVKIDNVEYKIKNNNENTTNNSIQFNKWEKLIEDIFHNKKGIETYKQLFKDMWKNKEMYLILKGDAVIVDPPSVAKLSLIFIEEDVLQKYSPLNPSKILEIPKSSIIRECLINLLVELKSKNFNLICLSICFSKIYQKIKGVDNGMESFYRFCSVIKIFMKTIDKWFLKNMMNKDYMSFFILCDYIIGGDNSWMFLRQETKDYDTLTDCLKKAYKYYGYAKHITYDIGRWTISLKKSSNSFNINTLSSNGSNNSTCI